ncbi:MAG: pyridoxal phosphate-dependent aminotransferase [Candidatus Gracilibacteria bacterium]|jgi:aspartate/methionine/tyrosine aminotransferase|nr:pyridoxal phosphate-dependent aminotransferase [Candidatus Gracilibacteria bacterium]
MKKNFVDNEWGYDVAHTNPFWIALYNLREVAKASVGEGSVFDLSRGDPGYGRAPSVQGREFYSYLLFIDTLINNPDNHYVYDTRIFEEVMEFVKEKTHEQYSREIADKLLGELDFFLLEIVRMADAQGIVIEKDEVFFEVFKYASVSGGCYHDPQGEKVCRIVIADLYSRELKEKIHADDLIFVRGVSDGIGTFFKLMGEEGIGFLKAGDTVVAPSPAYAPYNQIFINRGINVLPVALDKTTGDIDDESRKKINEFEGNIKAVILIDPNNPTGLVATEMFKDTICRIAEKHNSIILTDEVYSLFFSNMTFIQPKSPKRVIRINGRSKIERSTGLRFADYMIPEETNQFITNEILRDYLPADQDLKKALTLAKAPGGVKGEFMHTTFVTGPSQFLGICHIVFGEDERHQYAEHVQKISKEFAELLGFTYQTNSYYFVFNMNDIASERKKALPAEQKFKELAERGIVLIPAYLFYSEKEKQDPNMKNMARACLPNLTPMAIRQAANIIRSYLQE